MIKFIFPSGSKMYVSAICYVPREALSIVDRYNHGFSDTPKHEDDGTFSEGVYEMTFEDAAYLMRDLAEAGFPATFEAVMRE